ncbi:hypothetical protein TRFO_08684 [Tritrichomonas foetus]|uniref:Right handed beta helix domain-containing protein n=1 Tax=Tritrichomonas foetus TaxID=1144522 RepID=A0A1J4JN78_9EUKA|nr:hypothetical protein TRFO_08684 [Tritrichomonas foetus]|eukprot:OHS98708.1 hypothetical protein TRFO_08684 [Tritrichomonas foetus]
MILFPLLFYFNGCYSSPNNDCQIIEDQTINSRLILNPSSDFCIKIKNCIFHNIECDIFDNGGAISVSHNLTTLTIQESLFTFCNCFQRKGGALFYQLKNATIDRCCAFCCFSIYGLFSEGVTSDFQYVNLSTITGCNTNDAKFSCAVMNTIGGTQILRNINSSMNNMNTFGAAGISVMSNELSLSFCSFSENIGESIININYDASPTFFIRSLEKINVYNNTIRTDSYISQAVVNIFTYNVTISDAIFVENSADNENKTFTFYEARTVKSLIIGCIFDNFKTKFSMNTQNCIFDTVAPTYNIQFLNTQMCNILPSEPSSKNTIIIVSSAVGGALLLTIVIIAIFLVIKRRKNKIITTVIDDRYLLDNNKDVV